MFLRLNSETLILLPISSCTRRAPFWWLPRKFLLYLIKLGAKSSNDSPRCVRFIRVSLWSILVAYSVPCFISAAILFFDSLSGGNETRFKQGNFVIATMRCIAFLSLAVMFIFGGVTRWVFCLPVNLLVWRRQVVMNCVLQTLTFFSATQLLNGQWTRFCRLLRYPNKLKNRSPTEAI